MEREAKKYQLQLLGCKLPVFESQIFLFAAQSNACLYDCWCHFPRGVLVVEVEILLAVDKCPTIRALKSFIAGFRNWSKNAQSIESRKVTDCCCAESGQEVEVCPTPDYA